MLKEETIKNPQRTLGPISDLEKHLPEEWWRTLFNSIYLKTDGDVVENSLNTRMEVDLVLEACPLSKQDPILDLCCGQGRHSIELSRRGFIDVTGIDRSKYLIRLARKRAKQEGLHTSFHEGDARKIRLSHNSKVCVLILGNSFGYFNQMEDDAAVLRSVKQILRSQGVLILDITDGEWIRTHFEPRSWEWIDANHFVCRERTLSSDETRLISREVVVHAELGVIADQFYAERLYSRDEIKELLVQAGYKNIIFHTTIIPHSTREQDLGMMSHRIFLSCNAPIKKDTRTHTIPTKFRTITVLLGDPSLPDEVKRDGKFNPEDFVTIERLQHALEEFKNYSFKYVQNHATLIKELLAHPPHFVFNLCDEGYKNRADYELHVPALLEMLHIPYTGAGPACLGMCYNKSIVRAVAESLDIPCPLETYVSADDISATLPSILPALVKPNCGDSSIGITKDALVHSSEELVSYLQTMHDQFPGQAFLIQEFLSGAEYSVGIIGNPSIDWETLPILEVDYSTLDPTLPQILSYESKWVPDSPYWNQISYKEAMLDEETKRSLIEYAIRLFERLGCRNIARFDFRADIHGTIKLLEVNPNPGWCWDGKMNMMAEMADWSYATFLMKTIHAAQQRYHLVSS